MEQSEGFAPIAAANARVLVLGSLPGRKSLSEQEYYAHPQNAFWPIMREVYGIDGEYADRCSGLIENRVALWDVLQASVRRGSLDADIREDTARANDFASFLAAHTDVCSILFNGKKAESLFMRMVANEQSFAARLSEVQLQGLPSTSPAYASMRFSGKLAAWKAALINAATN